MSPMLEAQLEAYFRQRVRVGLGGILVKMAPTVRGVPDRLVLLPAGRMYLVELKREGGRVSPIQAHWHEEAAKLGHTVAVLTGKDGIDEWVKARGRECDPAPGRAGRPPKVKQELVYTLSWDVGEGLMAATVVQHSACPSCGQPVVYNGSYYCSQLALRSGVCGWVLDSDDHSLANRRLAATLYDHYMRSTGQEPNPDTIDNLMAKPTRKRSTS